MRRVPRAVLLAVAGAMLASCGSDSATSPVRTDLDGPWSSHAPTVGVVLALTWSSDSVRGSGTYTVIDNTLGCGGGTLNESGTVTFAARVSASGTVGGYMQFDNGWSPPYTGTLVGDSEIDGAFSSIDAGACPFPLYRGLVP